MSLSLSLRVTLSLRPRLRLSLSLSVSQMNCVSQTCLRLRLRPSRLPRLSLLMSQDLHHTQAVQKADLLFREDVPQFWDAREACWNSLIMTRTPPPPTRLSKFVGLLVHCFNLPTACASIPSQPSSLPFIAFHCLSLPFISIRIPPNQPLDPTSGCCRLSLV